MGLCLYISYRMVVAYKFYNENNLFQCIFFLICSNLFWRNEDGDGVYKWRRKYFDQACPILETSMVGHIHPKGVCKL